MQIQPETIIWNQPSAAKAASAKREVFRMEKSGDDRITGSIPVWGKPETPEENIVSDLSAASKNSKDAATSKYATALADDASANKADDSFGFLDFVDMINPLQHIPVVSTIYQKITGDTMKPISQFVGGAAFGGPIGAAAGAVQALVQMETGKDLGGNVLASLEGDKTPVNTAANDTTIAVADLRSSTLHSYNS